MRLFKSKSTKRLEALEDFFGISFTENDGYGDPGYVQREYGTWQNMNKSVDKLNEKVFPPKGKSGRGVKFSG